VDIKEFEGKVAIEIIYGFFPDPLVAMFGENPDPVVDTAFG
jgi:hypothetical protein